MNQVYNICRSTLRYIFLYIFGTFKKPSACIHILNGHMVDWHHDNNADGERFRQQLAKLHNYGDFVDFDKAVHMIIHKEKVSRPTIAFSFDDGWSDCFTQIAPELEKYGINAMFFINPNLATAAEKHDMEYIENFTKNTTNSLGKHPMTWKQIKELHKRGFLIGAHTLDHYCINDNNIKELEHQIGDCRKIIEKELGVPCEYFAFPYGKLKHANPKSIEIACNHYKYVFSQSDHKHYFSYGGKVINRRHFEPFWPIKHIFYFLSSNRS